MAKKGIPMNKKLMQTLELVLILGLPMFLVACNSADKPLGQSGILSGFMRMVLVVIGILLLVAGYRISQFVLHLAGFAFGAIAGVSLAGRFVHDGSFLVTLAGFIIGGLIGAAIVQFLAEAGVFIVGALAGWLLGTTLVGLFHFANPTALVVSGVLALVGGLLLLALYKSWMIGVTSLLGAILLGMGTSSGLLLIIVFFAGGILIQSLFNRGRKH